MREMIHESITSRVDRLEISVMSVVPEGKIRGIVQLVHGMSEHKERYLPFMEYLADRGFVCIIHDQRGHGKSVKYESDLGYMYGGGAEAYIADLLLINETARERYPGKPLILFGHSMGSLGVRVFAKRHPNCLDGLIVCGSPCKNPALAAGTTLAELAKDLFGNRHRCKLIESLSFGPYAMRFPKERNRFSWVCSDPQVVKDYADSPLCGVTFSADAYLVLFALMKETYDLEGWEAEHPHMPILFIGGAEDPCIGGRKKFAQAIHTMHRAGYENVKGRLYPGMRHEILNEPQKEKVYQEIVGYLGKQGF